MKFTLCVLRESTQYVMSASLSLIVTFFRKEYLFFVQFYYNPLGFCVYYEAFQAYKGK